MPLPEGDDKLAIVYLCLGSNLGDREKNLFQALVLLSKQANLDKVSSIYETEPVGYKQQPFFLNLVCRITTDLNAEEVLYLAKNIEYRMGRKSSGQANSPRPIDIDILFYDNQVIKAQNLSIPHPRLAQRAFVLTPLDEIAPELVHPELNKSIAQLAGNVKGCAGVRKWGGFNVPSICGTAF
jgi:2-amino-4-hydroxy-6-hydroxymethyldihydropteridine diphosphokinase